MLLVGEKNEVETRSDKVDPCTGPTYRHEERHHSPTDGKALAFVPHMSVNGCTRGENKDKWR